MGRSESYLGGEIDKIDTLWDMRPWAVDDSQVSRRATSWVLEEFTEKDLGRRCGGGELKSGLEILCPVNRVQFTAG